MNLNFEKLLTISGLAKLFFDPKAIDEKSRSVYFYPGIVFARNSFAGLLYLDGFMEVEESFAIPIDIFTSFEAFTGKFDGAVVELKADSQMVWKFGKTRYKAKSFSIDYEDVQGFLPKEDSRVVDLPNNFKEILRDGEFCASSDARQPSLYGVQLKGGAVASCDNMRAYLGMISGVLEEEELFITREAISILTAVGLTPNQLILEENRLFFVYDNFLIFTLLSGFNCPNIPKIFTEGGAKLGDFPVSGFNDSRESFERIRPLFRDKFSSPLKIKIDGATCFYESVSRVGTEELSGEFDVKYSGNSAEFTVNALYFFDGLVKFDKFYVLENMLYFEGSGENYILLLMK